MKINVLRINETKETYCVDEGKYMRIQDNFFSIISPTTRLLISIANVSSITIDN